MTGGRFELNIREDPLRKLPITGAGVLGATEGMSFLLGVLLLSDGTLHYNEGPCFKSGATTFDG